MNDMRTRSELCLQYNPNEVLPARDNKVCLIINIFCVVAQRGTKELLYTLQHKLNKNKGGVAGWKGSRVWSCPLSRGWRCHNSPSRDVVMLINKWTLVDHERGWTVRESRKPRYWNAMFCAELNRCREHKKTDVRTHHCGGCTPRRRFSFLAYPSYVALSSLDS